MKVTELRLLNLALTPVVILAAVCVCVVYGAKATYLPKKPTDYLVLGIFLGFAGKLFDNTFWGFLWILFEIDRGAFESASSVAPAVNIVFRQLPLILSAVCHLYAVRLTAKDECQ